MAVVADPSRGPKRSWRGTSLTRAADPPQTAPRNTATRRQRVITNRRLQTIWLVGDPFCHLRLSATEICPVPRSHPNAVLRPASFGSWGAPLVGDLEFHVAR